MSNLIITEPGTGWPAIPPEHELPHTSPGTPLWSESYFFWT